MSDSAELVVSARALVLVALSHLSEVLARDVEERLKNLTLKHLNRNLRVQVHQGVMSLRAPPESNLSTLLRETRTMLREYA